MTNQYKLPICWLGKAQVHDGKEHYVLPDEVNMNCTCVTPMQALLCMEGHMTECHKGMSCRGEKHGPYWYGHGDFGVPKYIGRMLPQWITDHVALLKKSKPKIQKIRKDLEKRQDVLEQELEQVRIRLDTLSNLENGDYTASAVLKDLGLAQFNGHGETS